MSALDERNTLNTLSLLGDALSADRDAQITGHTLSVSIREKVHVTHFVSFHDDWDFSDDAYVVAETETMIRVSADQHHVPGELTITFNKDRDLLVKRLPL